MDRSSRHAVPTLVVYGDLNLTMPTMVLPDGYASRGMGALARLIDGSWSRPVNANAG